MYLNFKYIGLYLKSKYPMPQNYKYNFENILHTLYLFIMVMTLVAIVYR